MTHDEIKTLLHTSSYDFLRTHKNLNNNIILLGLGGSHAYGLSTPTSDLDVRGIATRTADDILLGNDFGTFTNTATDTVIHSFDKALSMLADSNPNSIELLGLDPEDYLYVSEYGQMILDNKQAFLSKKCIRPFSGYINQQLYRLRQKSLCAMSEEEYLAHIVTVLNDMCEPFNQKHETDIELSVKNLDIVLNGHFEDLSLETLMDILSQINTTYREYKKRSKRNEHAIAHNKIAKHCSSLLNVYIMGLDILKKQEIITKRKEERQLLMDIKSGKYLAEDGKPNQEFFDIVTDYEKQFKEAIASTKLPDEPDYKTIEALKIKINKEIISSH